MNAEAGVPVGDSTLLARIEEAIHLDSVGLAYGQGFVAEVGPAVVTLIKSAHGFIDCYQPDGYPSDLTRDEFLALRAALAPFVGEATDG